MHRYISSEDALLKRRRAFAHQPVAWFRNPYAQLVLVRCCIPQPVKLEFGQSAIRGELCAKHDIAWQGIPEAPSV